MDQISCQKGGHVHEICSLHLPWRQRQFLWLLRQRLDNLGMAMALIDSRVGAEVIKVTFSLDIPHVHALAATERHGQRMIVVGAVLLFACKDRFAAGCGGGRLFGLRALRNAAQPAGNAACAQFGEHVSGTSYINKWSGSILFLFVCTSTLDRCLRLTESSRTAAARYLYSVYAR